MTDEGGAKQLSSKTSALPVYVDTVPLRGVPGSIRLIQ